MKKDFLKRQILMACAVGVGVLALSSGNAFAEENVYGAAEGTVAGVSGSATTDAENAIASGGNITVDGNFGDVYGGYNLKGDANGNIITINNGSFDGMEMIAGGFGGSWEAVGNANNNMVMINGGTIKNECVVGGHATKGSAVGNTVVINGGTITGNVFGGWATGEGTIDSKDNTVSLGGFIKDGKHITEGSWKADIGKNLYINAVDVEEETKAKGGTLNVYNFGNTVGGDLIATNANINFYITDNNITDPMLNVKGTANVDGSTLHAEAVNVALVKDTTINLLKAGTLKADDVKGLKGGTLSDGFTDVNLTIKKSDANTIVAVVNEGGTGGDGDFGKSEENRKSPAETQVVGVALVNAGSDMISSKSFGDAATAINANVATGGSASTMAPFASMGGSNIRQESGSYVDMKSWNISVGFAKDVENSKGKLMFGPIIEYGRGSYDSHLDNGTKGEGNSSFWGIGGMVKQTNNDGLYYEGSLRIGKVKNDYSTSNVGPAGVSYDNSATYYAMHAGVGKVVAINDANSIDYYGKLFWSHQNGSTATLSNGYVYDFEATNSVRSKLGFRYNHNMDVKNTIYAGLAWQHEFNGTANAIIHNGGISSSAPAPSVKGETGILELGWKINPTDTSRFEMDLGLTGYTGKQKGVGANVNFLWHF